jgi:hypothetical protein
MVWVVSLSCAELIPRALPPGVRVDGIRSLVGFGNRVRPLAHPVLYLRDSIVPRLYLNRFRGVPAISEFD